MVDLDCLFFTRYIINMSDGSMKPIEEINVGDEVLSIDLPFFFDEDLGYSEWKFLYNETYGQFTRND